MIRLILATALMIGGLVSVRAQVSLASGGADVEVTRVQSGTVRGADGAFWYQIEIRVRTKGSGSGRGRYANRVGLTLNLATEVDDAPLGLEFYRSTATAMALETGQSAFRFYLPPEIVSRDRLQGTLRFWTIDLSVDGRAKPNSRALVGEGFSTPAAVENFRQKLAREAERNDGVLLPQHLTPFAGTDGAPTMMREESTRIRP